MDPALVLRRQFELRTYQRSVKIVQTMRQHGQEAVARDGRQRALHRLRLCRPRTGHPRLHGLKVPERGSDVRQRQPRPRAGGHPRRVRGQAGQGHGGADRRRQREGRQRLSGER